MTPCWIPYLEDRVHEAEVACVDKSTRHKGLIAHRSSGRLIYGSAEALHSCQDGAAQGLWWPLVCLLGLCCCSVLRRCFLHVLATQVGPCLLMMQGHASQDELRSTSALLQLMAQCVIQGGGDRSGMESMRPCKDGISRGRRQQITFFGAAEVGSGWGSSVLSI